jgi:hypothetical protein
MYPPPLPQERSVWQEQSWRDAPMNAFVDTTIKFCTGRGPYDTHAVTLSDGRPNPQQSAGTDYQGITGGEIVAMVKDPPRVPKEKAQWLVPSDYLASDARDHQLQRERGQFWFLALDVDQKDLALGDLQKALESVLGDCAKLIYSTRSATADNRKWRALIPLKSPLAGADYANSMIAFYELLQDASGGVLIPDRALARPGQLVYLPNKGAFYEYAVIKGGRADLTPDHPVIIRRDETRAARAKAEAKAREWKAWKAQNAPTDAGSIVDAFNASTTVADALARYGYVQAGQSDDWRSPMQTSGSFATRDYGDHWISLSGSDAAAGIGRESKSGQRCGDAFDLFVHFEHGGEHKAAVRSYAEQIGLDYKSKAKAAQQAFGAQTEILSARAGR